MELDYDDKKIICDKEGNLLFEIYHGEPISVYKLLLMIENNYTKEEIAFYFDTKKDIICKIYEDILSYYSCSY